MMKHFAKIQAEFLKIAEDDLSGTVHKEQEHRLVLLEQPPEIKDVNPTIIRQGMLREVRKNDQTFAYARMRMKQEFSKEPKYVLGVKHLFLQQEAETEISKEMFDAFYPNNIDKPQEKYRYTLKNGWEIDIVQGTNEIYAEYEYDGKEKVIVPKHWKVKQF